MKNFTTVFNFRVLIVFILTSITYYLCLTYNFYLKNDYNIISIAIVFPLVFCITSAFQKRQSALRYFSEVRSNLVGIMEYFYSLKKMKDSERLDLKALLIDISNMNVKYLTKKDNGIGINDIRIKLAALHDIILKSNFDENLYRGIMQTKQELSRCIENLSSLKNHNTPKSLRAYCLLFIYIFPFIYVPGILGDTNVSDMQHNVLIYVLCILISFVLVALYNIQDFIENPFDNEGLDDIKMDDYFMDKKEL